MVTSQKNGCVGGRLLALIASRSNDASLADTWRLVYLLCSGLN